MALLIVFLPLLGSIIAGMSIIFSYHRLAEVVTSVIICISAILSIYLYVYTPELPQTYFLFNWMSFNEDSISWSIFLDELTSVMFVVVTFISAMVHLYSIGYMAKEGGKARFFCYLSLFTFAMLLLVSSENFIQLFVFVVFY